MAGAAEVGLSAGAAEAEVGLSAGAGAGAAEVGLSVGGELAEGLAEGARRLAAVMGRLAAEQAGIPGA